jgi:hypothetical protein
MVHLLWGGSALDDAHDVGLFHDLSPRPLAEQHEVARPEIEGNELAALRSLYVDTCFISLFRPSSLQSRIRSSRRHWEEPSGVGGRRFFDGYGDEAIEGSRGPAILSFSSTLLTREVAGCPSNDHSIRARMAT